MTRTLSLFGLRIRHDYPPDQVCRDLRITPTAATRRLLDRHRLLLQLRPDGIGVVALTGADAKSALIALPRGEVFGFELSAPDPGFAAYSDLRDFVGKADPVYRNTATGASADPTLTLSDRESWATETIVAPAKAAKFKAVLAGRPLALDGDAAKRPRAADIRLMPPAGTVKVTAFDATTRMITLGAVTAGQRIVLRYRSQAPAHPGRLAAIELRYDKSMPTPGTDAVPFEVRFKARSARWAYYLLTDQDGDFSIVDAMPVGSALAFSPSNRVQLDPATEATDPFAQALSRQHAGLRRLRFLSDQPVPCSSTTRRGIELRLGDRRVLAAIANPSPENLSRILLKPGAPGAPLQGQDTFHQVIRCLNAS